MYCLSQEKVDSLLKDVRRAGEACLEIYRQDDFGIQIKSDNSPVTKADLEVNDILTEALRKLTPDIPIISEEANLPFEERKDYDLFWILDPIDGTKEFIKKSGEFTLNIGLVENKKPIFGIIYIPVTDEMFWGGRIDDGHKSTGIETVDYLSKKSFVRKKTLDKYIERTQELIKLKEAAVYTQNFDEAAKLRDQIAEREQLVQKEAFSEKSYHSALASKKIKVRSLIRMPQTWRDDYCLDITCSKDHRHPNDWEFIKNISLDNHIKLIPCGSTIKICRIAEGKADLYIRMSGINDWDLAAGHAIIEAAGGHVTTLDGRELIYNTEGQRLEPFIVFGAQQLDWTKWAPDESK